MIKPHKLSLFARIKHASWRYFFADEVARNALERETFLKLQKEYEQKIEDFSAWATKHTIVDAVRTQLKGFNPKLLDNDSDLPEILGDIEAQDPFLAKMKSLKDMPELWVLIDYLIRNQVIFLAREATNMESINFGRATINGLSLFKEEVERLATIYSERHTDESGYDKHAVT